MKTKIGMVLIALGLVFLIVQGVSYTTKDTIVDVGPLEITADDEKTIAFPPLVAGIVLLGGVGLVISGRQ